MPIVIPDEALEQAGIAPGEAMIEFACRLFEGKRLPLAQAARLAGLSRSDFDDELIERGIARYDPTSEDLDAELAAMERLGVGT